MTFITNDMANTTNPIGELRYGPDGGTYRIVATRAQTGNSHFAVEASVQPDGGSQPHIHTREDVFVYVLEGEITFWFDGRFMIRPAGSTAFVPRGTPHCFKNFSEQPARMLAVFTPGEIERYFEFGLPLPDGSAPSDEIIIGRAAALAPVYGLKLLGHLPEHEKSHHG